MTEPREPQTLWYHDSASDCYALPRTCPGHRGAPLEAAQSAGPAGDAGLREALQRVVVWAEQSRYHPHGMSFDFVGLSEDARAALAANPPTAPDADRNVEWIPAPLPVGSPYTPEQADRVLAIGRAVWAAPDAEVARRGYRDHDTACGEGHRPDCPPHGFSADAAGRLVPWDTLSRLPVATASTGPTGLDRLDEVFRDMDGASMSAQADGHYNLDWRQWSPSEIAAAVRIRLRPTPPAQPETDRG